MSDIKLEGGEMMNCHGCNCQSQRGFFTKEEKVGMLKEYKESLEKEAKGVGERIAELEEE